jgi:hypothetical protein
LVARPPLKLPCQRLQSVAMRFARTKRGSSDILSRCGSCRLWGKVCDLPPPRAPAPRCRPHHHGCGRAVRAADRLEWLAADQVHHAAFDAQLIGIDPDFRIHVSDRLLEIHDGPFLELGLKGIVGMLIDRPRRLEDRSDRDRLARRFEVFKKAA